jgi:hypothetical protein
MGVIAALSKVPWKKIIRYLPGTLGIASEIISRREEKTQVVNLRLLESQQKNLADTVSHLESQMIIVFWAAIAAIVLAFAALAVALLM